MTITSNYLLTAFRRSDNLPLESVLEADGLEQFGTHACSLFHGAFGTKIFTYKKQNGIVFEEFNSRGMSSVIGKFIAFVVFILTLPISAPSTIVGIICLNYSKSYAHIFNEMAKTKENNSSFEIL